MGCDQINIQEDMSLVKVLFVCLGNICRSPMAEALFRHMVKQEGLAEHISIDSAGTHHGNVGKPPHHGTRAVLDKKGIDYSGMKARQITVEDFAQFDYIVCMDQQNLDKLAELSNDLSHVYRLLDFAPEKEWRDIEDPYYTGRFDFVYELVEAGCRGLLAEIRNKYNLTPTK